MTTPAYHKSSYPPMPEVGSYIITPLANNGWWKVMDVDGNGFTVTNKPGQHRFIAEWSNTHHTFKYVPRDELLKAMLLGELW